jgi:mono/diheme cytochrome c family protein
MTRPFVPATVLGSLALLALAACGSARRSEPIEGRFVPPDAEVHRGQVVFFEHCHKCHPGGEAGLGPGLNDKPLPAFLIRTQVRRGLGVMPAFDEERIPDDDLDALVEFLLEYRRHG